MGYDHAEEKEVDPPVTPPSSSSREGNGFSSFDAEKQTGWVDDEDQDKITSLPSYKADGGELKKTHTHTLGKLKLRAADDDDPSDWWFASTAIPLIAATFAPMANLLSIAALVVSWRNNTITNDPLTRESTSIGYHDPPWCIDLNVTSLVCGFVGNLFLLFNFTKRVRYIVALPATIFLFYLASGILIGITVSMHMYTPPDGDKGQIYSQGFWHAVIAAALYMFNSMILMVNMWGYFLGHYPQHFTLTDEQRNLILQTMMFFIWLGGGAGIFARTEGWTYPDALYFCDVTILTIGFGDLYATDDLGRGLVFPYSVGGTIILGLMVSSIHKFAGELSQDKVLRKHVETRRVNTLNRVVTVEDEEDKKRAHLEQEIKNLHGLKPAISRPLPDPEIQKKLDDMAKKLPEGQRDDSEPSANQFMRSNLHRGPLHQTLRVITRPISTMKKVRTRSQKVLLMRKEKDRFDAMRSIQENAHTFKKWYALLISGFAFGILWCVGAVVFWRAEHRTQGLTYFRGLYFCYVSLLTIGYGDLSPKSNAGKPFFVVWSLIAVPTMTILISDMGDTVISSFKQGTFRLADFTVLPKAGLWRDFVESHPRLWKWMNRISEKRRIKKGLPIGPATDDDWHNFRQHTIEQLASEELDETEMTKNLAFAIRKTADDLTNQKRRHYTYEEWVEFTRLIRFTKIDNIHQLGYSEEHDGIVEWDWLDENSPMLSDQSESEWILDRLCESLLRLLKKRQPGIAHGPDSASSTAVGFGRFSFASTGHDGSMTEVDPKSGSNQEKDIPEEKPLTKTQERRQRAAGADAVLTFFTGERRGTQAYASNSPMWSKKALERQQNQRRKSSSGGRRGPFTKLHHRSVSGAVGGGRGGAANRKIKTAYADDDQ